MKRIFLSLALCLLFPVIVAAQQKPDGGVLSLALFPERLPEPGASIRVVAQLTRDGKPLTEDELKTVHTQKFHLLVVDPTLTDYQHLHPQPTATPGSFLFTFTPKLAGGYRAWADITPVGGTQHYLAADLGTPAAPVIDKKESDQIVVDGYRFGLTFDERPVAGGESMGDITITDANGKPVTSLEPVMGAFAHIVGFYDDYKTVMHTHPMGDEPASDAARGGPMLMFHLAPERAGFVRLFAQVKIDGKELFVPFGIKVTGDGKED